MTSVSTQYRVVAHGGLNPLPLEIIEANKLCPLYKPTAGLESRGGAGPQAEDLAP